MTTRRKASVRAGAEPRKAGSRGRASPEVKSSRKGARKVERTAARAPKRASGGAGSPLPAARKAGAAKNAVHAVATFPADCTIAQAEDIKSQLARMLAKPAGVTLDLSTIRRIDTAALQVLTSFIRDRRAAGREVSCSGASEPFMLTAELLGLSALFSSAVNA
jgi:anti-anti-sigma regulatory factor